MVSLKKIFAQRKQRDLFLLLAGFLALILINVLTSIRFTRIDLTAEKRYSLSDSTKKMLRELDDVVLFKVYLEGDLSAKYKKLRNSIREMLDEFNYYANGNIQYTFIDPFADPSKEAQDALQKELINYGLYPTTDTEMDENSLSRKNIYPGAVASYNTKEVPVQFLQSKFVQGDESQINQSIQNLEYEIASAIYKLRYFDQKKKIAFSYGHREIPDKYISDILFELKDFYDLERVEISNDLDILNASHNVLVVAKPDSIFDDAGRFILDQYVMNGGKVLWLIDPNDFRLDSLVVHNYSTARPRELGLMDMLFKWGAKLNYDIIEDLQCAPISIDVGYQGNQSKFQLFPWYFFPVLVQDSIQHPIVKNTSGLRLMVASSVDTSIVPGVEKTILLTTSKNTKVMRAPSRVSLNVIEQKPDRKYFNRSKVPVAVLLEGEFSSIYENRLAPISDRQLKLKSKPTKMIVVSDGDIIRNDYSEQKKERLPLGLDPSTGIYYAGNKTFLLNSINYLAGDNWFIALRAKEFKIRLLDKDKIKLNRNTVKIINIAVPIAIVLVFGLVFNFIRRRKYA